MINETVTSIVRWLVSVVVCIAAINFAYQLGRVVERRAAEPIVAALQEHNECLNKVNDRYRLVLYDIGGGYCGK